MDGRIWAENNSDENGAIFSFTLPIADVDTKAISLEQGLEQLTLSHPH